MPTPTPSRHGDVDEVVRVLGAVLAEPHVGERAGDRRVLDVDGEPRAGGERVADVDVAPAELRGVQHAPGLPVDHARDDEADPLAAAGRAVVAEEPRDPLDERVDERRRVDERLERLGGDGAAAEVAEHEVGAAEADVDADDEPVAGADVEHLRLAAARGVDRGALVDRLLAEQLVDERGDHAAADLHAAREVGARDRLVLADEVEHDLPVDLARRGAGRADEAAGVDLSHGHLCCHAGRAGRAGAARGAVPAVPRSYCADHCGGAESGVHCRRHLFFARTIFRRRRRFVQRHPADERPRRPARDPSTRRALPGRSTRPASASPCSPEIVRCPSKSS